MIPMSELGPQEVVYTWENPDVPNTVRMWAMDRLQAWLDETRHKKSYSLIDQEKADFFLKNRGIERHRVQWLLENPTALNNPVIIMRMQRSVLHREVWDLMLDGHHHYVAKAILGQTKFFVYHITEEDAKPFEVSGIPPTSGSFNVNSFSGLGLDR